MGIERVLFIIFVIFFSLSCGCLFFFGGSLLFGLNLEESFWYGVATTCLMAVVVLLFGRFDANPAKPDRRTKDITLDNSR